MPAFTVHKFSEPAAVKRIAQRYLIQFLEPYREYLGRRGFTLPREPSEDFDYPALTRVLMSPDEHVPPLMVEALYHVHELANEDEIDDLVALAEQHDVDLDLAPDPTPADVAIQIWLKNRDLLKRRHAEKYALRQKRFAFYRGRLPGPVPFPTVTESQITALEEDMDDWFEAKKRGRGSNVLTMKQENQVWLVVRHGLRFKREGSIRDGLSAIEYYRPEIYDVLVYDPNATGIWVHADGVRLHQMYLDKIGAFLFGDPSRFYFNKEVTLKPLVDYGEDALKCDDIDGVEWVKLTEYKRLRGGNYSWKDHQKADDLFAAMRAAEQTFPRSGHFVMGRLLFKFDDDEKPRGVDLSVPNIVSYTRNEDRERVEPFLRARGFMPQLHERVDEEARTILEDA